MLVLVSSLVLKPVHGFTLHRNDAKRVISRTSFSPSSPRRQSLPSYVSAETAPARTLQPDQLDFYVGYLNKHHGDLLKSWAEAFSPLGAEMAKANAWSGGSFTIRQATIVKLDTATAELSVKCAIRKKPDRIEAVQFSLDCDPVVERQRYYKMLPVLSVLTDADDTALLPIDLVTRKLCRLCSIVGQLEVTGRLLQLALQLQGAGFGKLPESMYLNQVPHNRYVRQYFYDTAAAAVKQAVILAAAGKHTPRMLLTSQFPEMNPAMDSYRIGTLLEMARDICLTLAEENLRVRLCVQQSMGVGIFTGLPKQLSGLSKLMQMMDWQSDVGEMNEGLIGSYVNFGAVGAEHVVNEKRDQDGNIVQHQDDVFLLLAPQSMVGTDSSIIPFLQEMVEAAGDRPVILINPDLTDKMSAAGQQSVRGRQQRIDFANSFATIHHFQNIYVSGTSYFPILGAVTKLNPTEPWVALQRRDYQGDQEGEVYVPVLAGETAAAGEDILEAFER